MSSIPKDDDRATIQVTCADGSTEQVDRDELEGAGEILQAARVTNRIARVQPDAPECTGEVDCPVHAERMGQDEAQETDR